jgi:hypothetical protein
VRRAPHGIDMKPRSHSSRTDDPQAIDSIPQVPDFEAPSPTLQLDAINQRPIRDRKSSEAADTASAPAAVRCRLDVMLQTNC